VAELIVIINESYVICGSCRRERFVLFGLRANLASHFARSPLTLSSGYDSAGDRINCLASFAVTNLSGTNLNNRRLARKGGGQDVRSNLEPFVQYAG
jgi:hypothetical protein